MRTLVIGLGNPILSDDGVGVRIAYAIQERLPETSRVEVRELSVGGLALMEAMVGYEKVIIIDAIQTKDAKIGKITRMTIDDLRDISPTQHSASAHDASLITALDLAERMGLAIPKEITIFAIEVDNIYDFSDQPTPDVMSAIPIATDAVMKELGYDQSV